MCRPGDPLVVGHIYVPEVGNGYKIAVGGRGGVMVVGDICARRGRGEGGGVIWCVRV